MPLGKGPMPCGVLSYEFYMDHMKFTYEAYIRTSVGSEVLVSIPHDLAKDWGDYKPENSPSFINDVFEYGLRYGQVAMVNTWSSPTVQVGLAMEWYEEPTPNPTGFLGGSRNGEVRVSYLAVLSYIEATLPKFVTHTPVPLKVASVVGVYFWRTCIWLASTGRILSAWRIGIRQCHQKNLMRCFLVRWRSSRFCGRFLLTTLFGRSMYD